jgi:hypothetical protein
MATKFDLDDWIAEALRARRGAGSIVDVSSDVWRAHEADLKLSGDLFYTWQYDIRWAAYRLRKVGIMRPAAKSPNGVWELV